MSLKKSENILLRELLLIRVPQLNEIITPGFNYGEAKNDSPRDFFAALVLNKIYSLNVSIENSLLCNDVFLSVYLYRYAYELYIKVFFIFSGTDEEELRRLNDFFENKEWKISDIQDKIDEKLIPPNLKADHKEKYKIMSRIVHPNINSLNLHANRTDDSQFEFLVPNLKLSIWHIVEIIRLFALKKLIKLDRNINQDKLESLQDI